MRLEPRVSNAFGIPIMVGNVKAQASGPIQRFKSGLLDLTGILPIARRRARRLYFSPVRLLVERFNTELFSDFSAESSNFRGLVLFCIDADFCVQILILQHFSRSTRFTFLHTAPCSTFADFSVFLKNVIKNFRKISGFCKFSILAEISHFRSDFDEISKFE